MAGRLTTVVGLVRDFVRDTLGCSCPEELLRRVEREQRAAQAEDLPAHQVLTVGNRLLIYLWETDVLNPDATVARLLAAGRSERDRRGLNRFRLVVAHPDPAQIEPALQSAFVAWKPAAEDRVHLHLLRPGDLPAG